MCCVGVGGGFWGVFLGGREFEDYRRCVCKGDGEEKNRLGREIVEDV